MAVRNAPPRLTLSQLPLEIQERIISHVPRKHLFKLQRTSLHFFSLASAKLYANLEFLFTVTGTKTADTPAARIAEALDTFATSEFDYAQYVKSFKLSISYEESYNAMTLTRLFWPSESDPTKILNMAIVLMLKKARTMETFHWDVPVELTRRVYTALHSIQSLRHLRIKSPGIPIKLAIQPSVPNPVYQQPGGSLQQAQTMLAATPVSSSLMSTGKRLGKKSKSKVDEGTTGTFAGFTKLTSAAFIDLSNLNCINDIGECIKASSKSLRSLSLSLSYELASKSRRSTTTAPPPNADDLDDGDFSDETEDILNADNPPAPPSQPVSAAEARKDKLAQDAILATIFDMQGQIGEGKKIENEVLLEAKKDVQSAAAKDSDFSVLASLARLLTAAIGGTPKRGEIQRLTDLMCQVTKELDRAHDAKAMASEAVVVPQGSNNQLTDLAALTSGLQESTNPLTTLNGGNPTLSAVGQSFPVPDLLEFQDAELNSVGPSSAADNQPGQSAETYESTHSPNDPDVDVDMDHPDESTVHLGPDQEEMDLDEAESSPRKRTKFEEPLKATGNSAPVGEGASSSISNSKAKSLEERPDESMPTRPPEKDSAMRKYIRAAHGLQLEEFSLYLIPLKASIVARALDMTILKRITLLEVGSQASFWVLLHRLAKTIPDLGFHMIHTDDVSYAFLNFLNTYEGLRELYMHKKKKRDVEPDSTTPKADIKSICKLGLRKHLDTLTHLMLKNDADDTWDLDQPTVRILSLRGSGLVELVVGMKMTTLHTLVQNISSFTSLRTLYFTHLRSTSSAASLYDVDPVGFLMDSLIHFPNRKIKYLGVSDRFATVDSPAEIKKRVKSVIDKRIAATRKKTMSGKGKGKEPEGDQANKAFDELLTPVDEDSWDESSAEHLIMKAQECTLKWHTKFWEAEDCKVFQKGIRQGKLTFGAG